jgi:hypothetical protein
MEHVLKTDMVTDILNLRFTASQDLFFTSCPILPLVGDVLPSINKAVNVDTTTI